MRKLLLIAILLFIVGMSFAVNDTLQICTQDQISWAVVESVLIVRDTTLVGTKDTTHYYTAVSTGCVKMLMTEDQYFFNFEKAGYYTDSTSIVWVDSTDGVITLYYSVEAFSTQMGVVCRISNSSINDTVMAYAEGIVIDVVNASDDTLYEGTVDSVGTYAWDPDSLTDNAVYWVYAKDTTDTTYADNYAVFTHSAGVRNKVVTIDMDSSAVWTMNDITTTCYDISTGRKRANVRASAVYRTPLHSGSGSSTVWMMSTSSKKYFYSDTNGLLTIKCPDNAWVDISIPSAYSYEAGFYCTQDTVLGQIDVR